MLVENILFLQYNKCYFGTIPIKEFWDEFKWIKTCTGRRIRISCLNYWSLQGCTAGKT